MKEDFFSIKLLKLLTVKIAQGVSLPPPYFPDKKKKKIPTDWTSQLKN